MKTLMGLFVLGLFSASAQGALECEAKVTVHRFKVIVATPGGPSDVRVETSAGAVFAGRAVYTLSPRARSEIYHLQLNHMSGIFLEVEQGTGRAALCLKTNECYLCK